MSLLRKNMPNYKLHVKLSISSNNLKELQMKIFIERQDM